MNPCSLLTYLNVLSVTLDACRARKRSCRYVSRLLLNSALIVKTSPEVFLD